MKSAAGHEKGSTKSLDDRVSPAAFRCSDRVQTASYSIANERLAKRVTFRSLAAINNAADAPLGLRMPATTTSVSKTNRSHHM